MNSRVPTSLPPDHRSLASRLALDPDARSVLMEVLKNGAHQAYEDFLPRFTHSLTPFQRNLYAAMQVFRYDQKDWWRDPHDIIVVRSMAQIVERERERQGRNLPEWLVTCALLHDRGYGILPLVASDQQKSYLAHKGAHWESLDSRLLHSRLSRLYACYKLFSDQLDNEETGGLEEYLKILKEHDQPLPGEQVPADIKADRQLFLEVVEKHDHALIGKYDQIPLIGRAHFDADSLYSISVSSFVKDYLSYANDPASTKAKLAYAAGLCAAGEFTPATLLAIRLARYYPSEKELPPGWDLACYPLKGAAVTLTEGGRCFPPHSISAKQMTDQAFLKLAETCRVLDSVATAGEFKRWYIDQLSTDYNELFR